MRTLPPGVLVTKKMLWLGAYAPSGGFWSQKTTYVFEMYETYKIYGTLRIIRSSLAKMQLSVDYETGQDAVGR